MSGNNDSDFGRVSERAGRIRENVGRVIVGKEDVVTLLLVALLSEGHVLIEDVPGVGKTTLAKALARSLDLSFSRIQFTPDVLPSDITGISYFNQKTQEFQFRQGPVFANIVLTDEINRATPRTQSALLEAMEERQATIEGETRRLPRPFLVLATENPIELEGTFPLPEAQLDRFMIRTSIGYPEREEEIEVAERFFETSPLELLESVVTSEELAEMAKVSRRAHVSRDVAAYIVDVVRATRERQGVTLGASPRATLALYRGSQALAAMEGRAYVIPDDVKALAIPVLGHRVILSAQGRLAVRESGDLIEAVLSEVPAPVEDEQRVGV